MTLGELRELLKQYPDNVEIEIDSRRVELNEGSFYLDNDLPDSKVHVLNIFT